MKNPFKKKKASPAQPVEDIQTTVLRANYALIRETHLLVRDPDGEWVAYQKDPAKGSWYVWRVLTMLPEVRAERPVMGGKVIDEDPHHRTISPKWDVPDTFPAEWGAR